jgi:hypothetical protein
VNDPTANVLNDEQHVNVFERRGWDGEEIGGRDLVTMIVEKSLPGCARVRASSERTKVSRNSSF